MDPEEIAVAVNDAIRKFGRPYEAPIELTQIVPPTTTGGVLSVDLNDLRKGTSGGPNFSIYVDTSEHTTPAAIREYVRERIAERLGKAPE
jgi:hypothetical protein